MRIATVSGITGALLLAALAIVGRVGNAQTPAPAQDSPAAVVPLPAEQNNATAPTPPAAAPAPAPAAPAPSNPPSAAPAPEQPAAAQPATPPAPPPAIADKPAATDKPATAEAPVPPAKPEEKSLVKKIVGAARDLFSAKKLPSIGHAAAIGYYPRGCLQGGVELPTTGPTWQVMRLSRNRNWGHPSLVKFLERFAPRAAKATGWNGILVGDMAQPRGGPLPYGHMSHQIGLDVDIWFMPMPDHKLTAEERENISASNMVADDWKHINPAMFTPAHVKFIKVAAEDPSVERVLVNAAIKKELCRVEKPGDRAWMAKVRPWYGHHDHIHVRLACPPDSPNCRKQPEVSGGDQCTDKDLAFWFSDKVLHPKKVVTSAMAKPLMMSDLPPACRDVLQAPAASLR